MRLRTTFSLLAGTEGEVTTVPSPAPGTPSPSPAGSKFVNHYQVADRACDAVVVLTPLQAVATAAVLTRLARGRHRRPPLSAAVAAPSGWVSVVVPARDEAKRIAPCLEGLLRDPDASEVLVVDDRSRDDTAAVARAAGATVVPGGEPPPGWIGKPWALQQGVQAASGDIVICVDADTRPRPGLVRALAAALEDADLVTAGTRFVCDTAGERFLHPSMLASLVFRYGPADVQDPPRILSNGQCTAVRRAPFLAAGGYTAALGHMTDDAALARALAARGWRIAFRDGSELIEVKMHDSAAEAWREWGRSLALADVEPPAWRVADTAVVWLTMALPVLRAAGGRARALDWLLLAVRASMLVALRGSYTRRGAPYWLSFLADPATAVRLTLSNLRQTRTWRGRTYAAAPGRPAPR
jgi:dolichol-phosphate mannosyltransferase